MTISHRSKLLIAGALVILVVLLILFWPKTKTPHAPTSTVEQNSQTTKTNTLSVNKQKPAPTPLTPEQKQAASAQIVAQIFVERFGSYSSESQASNLEDILPLTTAQERVTLQAQIDKLRAAAPASSYYGVTTRFISATTVSMDAAAGTATFDVVTQREEAIGSVSNTSVKYQTITVKMKQSGEDWLVDGATWK